MSEGISKIETMVREFAPILHFHPKEGQYCCFPSDAEEVFDKYATDWTLFTKDLSPNTLDPSTPCYFETWKDKDFTQIRYWFWYRYNRYPRAPFGRGEHLGDWEHVEVRIYPRLEEGPATIWLLSNHLESRLSSNPGDRTLPGFEAEPPTLDDQHIHAWVALGSHSNYPSPGSRPFCAVRVLCDKISDDGPVWDSGRNLKRLEETNFAIYSGRWGDERAPRSPTNEYNNRWRNAPDVLPVLYTK